MKSFDKELKQFFIDGIFENNLDIAGNVNLLVDPVDINQTYIQYQLRYSLYNNEIINNLYDVSIREFNIPESQSNSTTTSLDADLLAKENETLKLQLNTIISSNNENSSSAIIDASKDTIIKLRMQLNEGTNVSDFSDVFPYLKK